MKTGFIALAAVLFGSAAAFAQDSDIRANLSNPILIVKDLDASVNFYLSCFGFERTGGGEITADVSKRTVGAAPDQTARSAYIRAKPLQNREPRLTGFAIVEISGGDEPAILPRVDGDNGAIHGEVILSLIVERIEDIVTCAMANGGSVLNEPEPSSSGKSVIASLVDPGGVRIEMYEYLPED
jgi:predicted enzyme related to lactoylglutathione lyase